MRVFSRLCLTSSIFFAFILPGYAQPADDILTTSAEQFKSLLANANHVVRNAAGILPFSGLDTMQLNLFSFDGPQDEIFRRGLSRYTRIGSHDLASAVSRGHPGIVVLGGKPPSEEDQHLIRKLMHLNLAVVVVASLDIFEYMPEAHDAPAVIHAFSDDPLAWDVLSQQLFGALPLPASSIRDASGNQLNKVTPLAGGMRLAFAPPKIAGVINSALHPEIDKIIREGLDSNAFPGCQVLAATNGQVFFHKVYGHHTYSRAQAVKHDDIYDLASITKASTATPALIRLYGEGVFDLDADLKTYVPSFRKSNKAELTWREILAHNARLKAWIPYWRSTKKKNGKFKGRTFKPDSSSTYPIRITDQLYLHKHYKEKKIYKAIRKSPLNDEAGYLYSGLSFYLYPEIIENLTQTDVETYLKQTFYHKLGAYTMTYNPMRYFSRSRIIPTERDTFFRMEQIHGTVHDEGAIMMGGVSCNAGLFANAVDLAKLWQMLLNSGSYGGDRYLEVDAVQEFTRCQRCDQGNRRGLGFDKPPLPSEAGTSSVAASTSPMSFGHSGYTGTMVWADPEKDLLFIFLSNRVHPTRLNRKLYTMQIRQRIQQVLYDSLPQK